MKLFRILFGIIAIIATIGAFTGAWHQLIIAGMSYVIYRTLKQEDNESSKENAID
ncbi:MAG: hypothetical protein ACRCZM_11795 [Bacteroidales bacterium]